MFQKAAEGCLANANRGHLTTLGPFIEAYIKARPKLKPSTITNLEQARRRLVEFFGSDRPMGEITPGDADEFRESLRGKMAENTIRRCCGRAKQFFRAALRKRLIAENPFGDMKGCSVQANKDREFFVDRPMSEKVLAECPDAEWRLLFALSRYGGLRCPSEHLLLTWEDINWESDRFSVHSPKTEHHEGKDSRVVPIFPELRPYLEAVFNQKESQLGRPPSPSDYVISRYRRKNSNLRTELKRIIKRTGLEPWPKLFQNLRASRATELAAEYLAFVAAAWLGHSTDVAKDHYWQVTDADYARAASKPTGNPVQNPVQSMHSGSQSGASERGESMHKNTKKPGKNRVSCERKAPPVGRPLSAKNMLFSLGKQGVSCSKENSQFCPKWPRFARSCPSFWATDWATVGQSGPILKSVQFWAVVEANRASHAACGRSLFIGPNRLSSLLIEPPVEVVLLADRPTRREPAVPGRGGPL
ncbi:MAG: tyrosine-type recombinase/integrase [Candidatus Anammoximicrobium sp.]|nr:tyrosine-type recombinase/integrase [Candidatus Anammoximicrobium sp.]